MDIVSLFHDLLGWLGVFIGQDFVLNAPFPEVGHVPDLVFEGGRDRGCSFTAGEHY